MLANCLLLSAAVVAAPHPLQCGAFGANVKRGLLLEALRDAIKPQLAQFYACRAHKALLTAPPLRQIPRLFRFLSAPVSGR